MFLMQNLVLNTTVPLPKLKSGPKKNAPKKTAKNGL